MKQKRIMYRVRLKAEAVWELLNRLNLTQNELARRIGRSSTKIPTVQRWLRRT